MLEPLRSRADLIVDTSEMSVHELAEMLRTRLLGKRERELTMVFESFGFKHGIPIDADYVFDVRFLPNPHWDPKLRPMTGLDKPVAAFLDRHTEVHNFIYQTRSYLELWLPMLETNNRSYLTVAIGCTGGSTVRCILQSNWQTTSARAVKRPVTPSDAGKKRKP